MSNVIIDTGIYFNYDLICYLYKGDIRDLLQFKKDLEFILEKCRPSSVTIHQFFQSVFTSEKTAELIKVIRSVLAKNKNYFCGNSLLKDDDVFFDTIFQAEYRLVSGDPNFMHYMWNKYSSMPVDGYDILSVGYTNEFHTISNVEGIVYYPSKNHLKNIKYDNFISESFKSIRKELGYSL